MFQTEEKLDIYSSTKILHIFTRCLGCTSYSILGHPGSRKLFRTQLGSILLTIQLVLILTLILLAVQQFIIYLEELPLTDKIPVIFNDISYIILIITVYYDSVKPSRIINILENIEKFDKKLEYFDISINYKKVKKITLTIVIIQVIYVTIYSSIDFTVETGNLSTLFYILSFLAFCEFVFTFRQCQLVMLFYVVKNIMWSINCNINKKKYEEIREKFQMTKAEFIETIVFMQYEVCDLYKKLNQYSNVFIARLCLSTLTSMTYIAYILTITGVLSHINIMWLLDSLLYISTGLIPFVAIISLITVTENEVRILKICFYILNYVFDF